MNRSCTCVIRMLQDKNMYHNLSQLQLSCNICFFKCLLTKETWRKFSGSDAGRLKLRETAKSKPVIPALLFPLRASAIYEISEYVYSIDYLLDISCKITEPLLRKKYIKTYAYLLASFINTHCVAYVVDKRVRYVHVYIRRTHVTYLKWHWPSLQLIN